MSWLDWLVVGMFGVIVLVVVGLMVRVAWAMLARFSLYVHGLDELDEDGCDDVPFPEAIGEEEGIRHQGSGIREEGRRTR